MPAGSVVASPGIASSPEGRAGVVSLARLSLVGGAMTLVHRIPGLTRYRAAWLQWRGHLCRAPVAP